MSTALRRVRKYFISSQVYEALRPLFFLTFLYGLTPFHVVRRKMGESYLKMSCFGIFNIFVYIVLCGFCYISSLRQGESIVGYFFRTEISTIGDRLQIFNGLIAGAVIYTSAILKRCKLLGTLTILHSLDTNFSNIGIRVKYSRIFRYSILLLVFKLLILGVYFVGVFRLLVSLGVTPSFCVCMTFFLQHSVVSIAICLFCVIAFSFERRLSIVNQVSYLKLIDARSMDWANSGPAQILKQVQTPTYYLLPITYYSLPLAGCSPLGNNIDCSATRCEINLC